MSFSRDDVEHLLLEIGQFAAERVRAATARPEMPVDAATLGALTDEAIELGLLSPADGDAESFALWRQVDQSEAMALGIGILRQLAAVNAGVAYAWHKMAMAGRAAQAFGWELPAATAGAMLFTATGHFGLARTALAKWVTAQQLDADEAALLADWLDRINNGTVVFGPDNWRAIIWPVWQSGQIAWRLDHRDDLVVRPLDRAHGLDELSAFEIRLRPDLPNHAARLAQDPVRVFERALKLDIIAMLAIGGGAARRAQGLAEAYAAMRRQGGKLIGQHPAVQLAIGQIRAACIAAEGALKGFERPLDAIDLGEVVAARLAHHPALTEAANNAMQVHGGVGYMRDTGPEKILRDQNLLRQTLGGLRAASLFLGALRLSRNH